MKHGNEFFRKRSVLRICCLIITVAGMAKAETMPLISPDKPEPVIIIGAEASPSENYAAHEMAEYLGKITGRKIKTFDDMRLPQGRTIIAIGKSKLTESIDTSGLNCEQFITDVQPDRVAIVGGRREAKPGQSARDNGTLYGVYEFLDKLGVRWYRPEPWGEFAPQMSTIELEIGRTVSPIPSYMLRSDVVGGLSHYWHQTTAEEKDLGVIWKVRNRLNLWDNSLKGDGYFYWYPGMEKKLVSPRDAELEAKLGGKEYYLWDHAFRYLVPPEKYFSSHPEYFALRSGKRDKSDLCLSNPELQKTVADNLIAKAKANPELSALSIEPPDCLGDTCECKLCKVMDLPLNTRVHGQGSNRIGKFCNLVAGLVDKKAPWVKLCWLGYSSHTSAPTNLTQLEPNTIVMIAPINQWNYWTKTLKASSGTPFDMIKLLKEWSALKPSCLMMWEYYGGYAWPGPLPMTYSIADRWRTYRKLGIKGIANEGETSWGPQGLDRYMCVRLMWNPDMDVDKELDLYYKNYYGPAAEPMKAYHEALFKAFENTPYPIWSGGHGMHMLFTPALVKKLGKYMNEAQELVKGKPLYEKRLHGVWAGYEFARRVSEILVLKKNSGVPVSSTDRVGDLAPEIARPTFSGAGNYLQSDQAEKAYGDLIRWMRSVNKDEHIFYMIQDESLCKITEDAAKTIFPKGLFESTWMYYLPYDLLMNFMNSSKPEKEVLEGF